MSKEKTLEKDFFHIDEQEEIISKMILADEKVEETKENKYVIKNKNHIGKIIRINGVIVDVEFKRYAPAIKMH